MEQIIDIIIKIVAILLSAGIAYLGKTVVTWIKSKLSEQQAEKLDRLIVELVSAAEQMYYDVDETGQMRKEYVTDRLMELGYAINQKINSKIESKVYELNLLKHGFPAVEEESNE